MTKEIVSTQDKTLSDISQQLIDELDRAAKKASEAHEVFKELIPELYTCLLEDGLGPFEARRIIEGRGWVSPRWLRELLPPEAKRTKMIRPKLRKSVPQFSNDAPAEIPAPTPKETVVDLYKAKLDVESKKALFGPKTNVKLYISDGVVVRVE